MDNLVHEDAFIKLKVLFSRVTDHMKWLTSSQKHKKIEKRNRPPSFLRSRFLLSVHRKGLERQSSEQGRGAGVGGDKKMINKSIFSGSCHKYHFCRDKTSFVATKLCLSRQTYFFRDKSRVLSRQK